jgi:hypothetical protein
MPMPNCMAFAAACHSRLRQLRETPGVTIQNLDERDRVCTEKPCYLHAGCEVAAIAIARMAVQRACH